MKSDILSKLSALKKLSELERDRDTIQEAIDAIKSLKEENESVWLMLDEIKASDIANYKKQIESAAAEKLLLALAKSRSNFNDSN